MKRCLHALVVLGLAAATASAHALTSAKVTIAQPLIKVVDLDLGDGVDAAYSAGGQAPSWFHAVLGPTAANPRFIQGSATVNETVLSIEGLASSPNSTFMGFADRWAPSFTFTVTPRTRVTIEVGYVLTGVVDGEHLGGLISPRALASFEFGLLAAKNLEFDPDSGMLVNFEEATSQFETVKLDSSEVPLRLGRPSDEGVLSLSFENLSTGEAVFAFRGQMVVLGNTADAVAAVPEPSTWMLAGLGIGLMGAWSRRRKISSRS